MTYSLEFQMLPKDAASKTKNEVNKASLLIANGYIISLKRAFSFKTYQTKN